MSIEDVALKRDDSDIIQFDNIFSNDLAKEQQLDLLFGAKEDDDIIRMIESRLFDENGIEKVFAVNEDDMSLLEEDDEEGGEVDISDNDSDDNGTDDDMEAEAPAEEPDASAAPKIAIDIDADNVNINAGDDAVKEDGDVNVTAQVANISPKADEAPMTGADLSAALTTDDDKPAEEVPDPVTPGDNEPAPEPDQKAVNGADSVVGEDFDNTKPENNNNDQASEPVTTDAEEDDNAKDLTKEDVMELNTASDLENAFNKALDEPAPAPEETSPTAEPEDPSTEVVFGDSNDMEEKSDIFGEDSDAAVRPESDTVVGSDDGNITHGDAPENANDGIPETTDPAHKDTSETQVGFLPRTAEELDAAMSTVDDLDIAQEAKEPEDPNEEAVENDAETSLLGIEPTLTAGDLDKMFNIAEEEPNKDGKYSQDLNEAEEPSKDDVVSEGECCGDSEPEEDKGKENLDNNIKKPETADELAKMLDKIETASDKAEKEQKETISGEEGVESKADEEWDDAVAKDDIASDEKLDDAKDDTGYKDNRDAGDQDPGDELNEDVDAPTTAADLEDMLSDIEVEAEPDPTEGDAPAECGSACGAPNECGDACKEDCDGVSEDDKDGGNTSDDDLSAKDFSTQVTNPKNDGDDEKIVDDKEQQGIDKEDGGAIDTADANKIPATAAELEAAFAEIAADSTEVIPDEVEVPKEDGEYDEAIVKDKVEAPGNVGNDPQVCVAAETAADLDAMFEDFEDQVEGISDDEVFNPDINTGLDTTPEDEEPGSIEEEIDSEALDFVESMK